MRRLCSTMPRPPGVTLRINHPTPIYVCQPCAAYPTSSSMPSPAAQPRAYLLHICTWGIHCACYSVPSRMRTSNPSFKLTLALALNVIIFARPSYNPNPAITLGPGPLALALALACIRSRQKKRIVRIRIRLLSQTATDPLAGVSEKVI